MDCGPWQVRLQSHGIRPLKLTAVRDWSESRVLRVEGTRGGEPIVCYLKWARRGMVEGRIASVKAS